MVVIFLVEVECFIWSLDGGPGQLVIVDCQWAICSTSALTALFGLLLGEPAGNKRALKGCQPCGAWV